MAKAAKTASSRAAVIVEIGNDWLKMVQSEPARGGLSISRLHLERYDSIGSAVAKSITSAIKSKKFSKMPVIACLPRQAVTIRMLEMPSTDADEIGDMVELQIGKQTPYSRDEILSDYRIVGAGREGYTRVMLAIVQRSALRERFHILEEAGLEVERMSVSTEGMLNWAARAAGGEQVVVLDVDSFYSDFVVMGVDGLLFTRSILVGANQLFEDVKKWQETLAKEALQSLETCRGDHPGITVSKLVLTGAGVRATGLGDYLGEKLGLPVELRDSLEDAKSVPKSPSLDEGDYRAVSLTPLVGVGMAPDALEFNLVPDSVKLRKGLESQARALTALGIAVMTMLLASSLYLSVKLAVKRGVYRELVEKSEKLQPEYKQVLGWRAVSDAVVTRKDLFRSAANVMAVIPPLTPEKVFFESIHLAVDADEPIEIIGTAETRKLALDFIANLENAPLFADVRDDGIDKDPKTQLYRFKVSLKWESGS